MPVADRFRCQCCLHWQGIGPRSGAASPRSGAAGFSKPVLSATAIGSTLRDHHALLEQIASAFMITMGLFFLATPFVLQLNREFRVDGLIKRAGRGGPLMIGAAFAVAWTPCVGPTLGAVLAAAALSGSAGHGALLLGVY